MLKKMPALAMAKGNGQPTFGQLLLVGKVRFRCKQVSEWAFRTKKLLPALSVHKNYTIMACSQTFKRL